MLSRFKKRLASSKGFTLIELLIVIAIIGVLAVALLAAINPVEQLRKSRDSARLADARELVNAYQRFVTTKQCYPHNFTSGTGCAAATVQDGTLMMTGTTPHADITEMIAEGEAKQTLASKSNFQVTYAGIDDDQTVSVCFQAESDSTRTTVNSQRYTVDLDGPTGAEGMTIAAATAACSGPYDGTTPNVANCMICVQ